MKVKIFPVNPFQMNSYVYYCENTGEGMIIDPGFYTKYEQDDLRTLNWTLRQELMVFFSTDLL